MNDRSNAVLGPARRFSDYYDEDCQVRFHGGAGGNFTKWHIKDNSQQSTVN